MTADCPCPLEIGCWNCRTKERQEAAVLVRQRLCEVQAAVTGLEDDWTERGHLCELAWDLIASTRQLIWLACQHESSGAGEPMRPELQRLFNLVKEDLRETQQGLGEVFKREGE